MNIGKYIKQLLLDNEMVIVPGFGAFISEYKPAELHDNSDELSPPSTQIIFNSQIRNNDGFLVGYVAENTRCSHFNALQKIEKERDNIIYKLDKGESVELEELGTLSYNDDNEIIFISLEEKTISLESFGLEAVTLNEEPEEKHTKETTEIPDTHEVVDSEEHKKEEIREKESDLNEEKEESYNKTIRYLEEEKEKKKKKRGWLWLLVLIPLIAVSVFAFLRGMQDGDADKQQNLTNETTIQQPLPAVVEKDSFTNDTIEKVEEDTIKQTEPPIADSVPIKKIPNEEQYYLISGSFSVESNAFTYMKELQAKGIDAFNAGKKGRFFCVGIGIFDTFEEAEKAKIEFMQNNPGSEGWVWKK